MFVIEAQAQTNDTSSFYGLALEFDRLWRAALKGVKAEVAGMVMDRTIRFGKLWESIPISHMVDGVWDSAGRFIHAGLSACRRAIINALDELVEAGVILRRTIRHRFADGYEYSINWSFDIMGLLPTPKKERARNSGLALPKNRSTSAENAPAPVQKMHRTSAENAPSNIDITIDQNIEESADAPSNALASIEQSVAGVRERNRSAVETRRKRRAATTVTALFEDWWKPLVVEHFPGTTVLPFNPKDRGCAKNLIKELGDKTTDIIEWSLSNWFLVKKAKFPTARAIDFPDTPTFGFFFGYRKSFIAAYNDREAARVLAVNPKAGLVQHFRKQGMDFEQALEAAGAEEVISQREQTLRKRENQIARAAEVLAKAQAQTGGRRPVEPLTREEFEARQEARRGTRAPRFTGPDEGSDTDSTSINITAWE